MPTAVAAVKQGAVDFLSNKQVAAKLGTVDSTVQAQRARALKRLGIDSVAELIWLLAHVDHAS